jgi:hypothetical protein
MGSDMKTSNFSPNTARRIVLFTVATMILGCASKPQVAVDPRSIPNQAKFQKDLEECTTVAENYDLTEGAVKTGAVGAVAGGGAAAGVATAVAGAIFWPAIPFIVGGAFVGGVGGGGVVKVKEADARETILADCMTERGYKTYKATNTANAVPNAEAAASNAAAANSSDASKQGKTIRPSKTDFAKLDDVDAVPNLTPERKNLYRKFLTEPLPRAFAISQNGFVGSASRGADSLDAAIYFCQLYAKQECTLYAVDNDIVYVKPEPK